MASTAAVHSGSERYGAPGESGSRPTRSRPTGAPTSSTSGRGSGGAQYGSPGSGPLMASSSAAVSRTVRLTTPSMVAPAQDSPTSGPCDTRARVGLSPTSPHSAAGIRIEPPPSLACATGTSPAATAAADPPLDPPVERDGSCGLRQAPLATGSVVMVVPNSGTFVRPRCTSPAARKRRARWLSPGHVTPASRRNDVP